MTQTRFYVNGYIYNLGELLSYEISKQDFDKIYNTQLELPDGMMSLKAIYKKKDPTEVIPDFNALVKHLTNK